MGGRKTVVAVLDQVQMLDQKIALPRPIAEQGLHIAQRGRIDLPALGMRHRLAAPGARMAALLAAGV
jgi:hypothetical protein